jgi:sugar/nucleoside kinase (ribokinase family)
MKNALVAGHICLDIIPSIPAAHADLLAPGRLVQVGAAAVCSGGPVSNTGLALHKLGIPVRLAGKVGRDALGTTLRSVLDEYAPALSAGITETGEAGTSYSVIVSPPGKDRTFWHYPGANDTFCAADIDPARLAQADLFHFGYPPIMRRIVTEDGRELARIFRHARKAGATTSLDMCFPDVHSESGRLDWRFILSRTLPDVDIFLPSVDEITFMLRRPLFERLNENGQFNENLTLSLVKEIGAELLALGARIVVLKLGERGLYLRTAEAETLRAAGRAAPADPNIWGDIEIYQPCFEVNVVGTTGSGDATIAGFLAAWLRGLDPVAAVRAAVAVGACNVEAADALSGLRNWEETVARMDSGWALKTLRLKD